MNIDRSIGGLLRNGLRWLAVLALTAVLTKLVNSAWDSGWAALNHAIGVQAAVLVVVIAFLVVSLATAAAVGGVQLPGRVAWIRVGFLARMLPFWIRELAHRGQIGSGRRNRRYRTIREFQTEDRRRKGPTQIDYGVGWGDGRRGGTYRVTWIEQTGELVAVGAFPRDERPVEVIAVIPDESEVDRRLEGWAYAGSGRGSLAWVRRRARGWMVPLRPRGQLMLKEDQQPPVPWPSPPPPTVGRKIGAYVGRKGDLEDTVDIVEPAERRPLYQYVESAPTGVSWGYTGAGPSDLARSILADRLGYVPQAPIYLAFRDEIVSALPDDFVLTFEQVDHWIDAHRRMFARAPRAEPFDPYAAGGA